MDKEKQIKEMARMTTDHPQLNVEVMLNYAYAKDGRVFLRYGDGDIDIDLCDYISRQAADFHCKPTPEEVMEGECMECDCPLGILYVVATQAAELRARLKEFEDREENKGEQSEGENISQMHPLNLSEREITMLKRIADALEKIADALGKDTDAATEEPKCENCKFYEEAILSDPLEIFPKPILKRRCRLVKRELIDGEKPCDYFEKR